ncbi:APC family permease [Anatilimnocola sp. NA78]|uniref:APC family permease n=1 Tax=Anatilimnocola sp. NA78 TaxID=3415683 RepID=UPI003CE4B003
MTNDPDPHKLTSQPSNPNAPPPKLNPDEPVQEVDADKAIEPVDGPGMTQAVKTLLVGKPLDLADHSIHQHISLIAFLAWVGLGADGLSSSCYGPSEAFEHLKGHTYLALFLALATVFTVFIISACYSYIIEAFPSGGGGYLVASKMLGKEVGALSGCALVIDYILTVTVSIAAAGDALFGLFGSSFLATASFLHLPIQDESSIKLLLEFSAIIFLVVLNLRGVKESVTILAPIFVIFLITHAVLIIGVLGSHAGDIGSLAGDVNSHIREDIRNPAVGWWFLLSMLLKAYSLGAGTYTGIEAVSNSMAVMREPRVATAQRTMIYMAISLAITAGGLMLAYLLFELDLKKYYGTVGSHKTAVATADSVEVSPPEPHRLDSLEALKHDRKQTMNDLLVQWFVSGTDDVIEKKQATWYAQVFRYITILSEAVLLLVAAQAGFIGGPKCLANMAHDSWVPHWFGSLSERLSSHYGIVLIGLSSIGALWVTNGNVSKLLIMYSINVFVTFTLSMIGMCLYYYPMRGKMKNWNLRMTLFTFGAVLCSSILVVTGIIKFADGAWITVVVTGILWCIAMLIRRYYVGVTARLRGLDETLGTIEVQGKPNRKAPNPEHPTAVILVGGYSGLGVHTLLNALRFVPNHFKNVIFISVGVVDSGNFKGVEAMEALREHTEDSLEKYVDLARRLGLPSRAYMSIGTDVVEELEQLSRVVHRDFPGAVVFAGQLVFQRETWYGKLLHNQTAYSLQRRLQWDGVPMVILPTRVRG